MAEMFKGNQGDLIEINRGPYEHWAVYIGDNEVVHFTTEGVQSSGSSANPSSSKGKVKIEKLTDVVGNHRYQVNNLLDDMHDADLPYIIVKEACKMVGRELEYNVDNYNCQHFATEMRYGKPKSRQVNVKPGDLIEINRGPYQHWVVSIGENEVVHFTTDGGQSSSSVANQRRCYGEVKLDKLTDVVGNHRYQVNNLLDDKRKARMLSIIVNEALAMVGSELPYNILTYNCEHFATEMRYGKAVSKQFKGKPGDLIEIFRPDPYQHWAVYIGGNEVIHLVNEGGNSSGSFVSQSSSNGKVKREKLTDVVGNHRYQVNNLLDKKWNPRETSIIVNEARAKVGELKYDAVSYNCEHFATEMRYGKAVSRQVVKATIAVASGTAGILLGLLGASASLSIPK